MKFKANLCLLTAALVWGFAFTAQRVGAEHLQCFSFNGIRFLLGSISLIPVILLMSRKLPKGKRMPELKKLLPASLLCGTLLCIASDLQQGAIAIAESTGKAGFITGLYVVMVPIASAVLFRKRIGGFTWTGVVCALAGMYLLNLAGEAVFGLGELLLVISTFFWTAHILCIDHFMAAGISSVWLSCGQFAVCGIVNLVLSFFLEDYSLADIQAAMLPLLYGGIMSVGVGFSLQVVGQKYANPTTATVLLSLESVFSAVGAALILHERMTVPAIIGCAFILAGIILAQITPERKAA